MTERSRFWDGNAALGDDGPYSTLHMHNQFFRSVLNGTGDRGVLRNWLNELLVSGISSPLTVASGGAIVYGFAYENDVATSVNVSVPSSGFSRYDRIVLQASWADYTVRVAKVTGIAAVIPVVPALTQAVGAIWEIPLATILIDDAGVIVVTDTRDFCSLTTDWAAGVVTTAKYASGAVTPADVPDRTRYELKGSGSIEPDSTTPCTWTAGASYDYWAFVDAATNTGWVYFMAPVGIPSNQVDLYLWSVPDVNGLGGGVENCQWDYDVYYGGENTTLPTTNGTVNVDQQARSNLSVYADALVAALTVEAGDIIILRIERAGAADSYNNDMRLLAAEMRWTADA